MVSAVVQKNGYYFDDQILKPEAVLNIEFWILKFELFKYRADFISLNRL
jgi:hypothetical protein